MNGTTVSLATDAVMVCCRSVILCDYKGTTRISSEYSNEYSRSINNANLALNVAVAAKEELKIIFQCF